MTFDGLSTKKLNFGPIKAGNYLKSQFFFKKNLTLITYKLNYTCKICLFMHNLEGQAILPFEMKLISS